MPSGTRELILLSGGPVPLSSIELAQLSILKMEMERLVALVQNKEDVEYTMVTRWLRTRVQEIEGR
mgnify:CR=1 FL=1